MKAPFRIPAVPARAFLLYLHALFCCTYRRLWARPRRPRIHPRKRKQAREERGSPESSRPRRAARRRPTSQPRLGRPNPEMAVTADPFRIRTPGPAPAEPWQSSADGQDLAIRRFFALPGPEPRRMSRAVRYLLLWPPRECRLSRVSRYSGILPARTSGLTGRLGTSIDSAPFSGAVQIPSYATGSHRHALS